MKQLTQILILVLLSAASASAQSGSVAINADGSIGNNRALLDLKCNSKASPVPILKAAQRNNIIAPANGLLVYQTDLPEGFYLNKGDGISPEWILLTLPAGTCKFGIESIPKSLNCTNKVWSCVKESGFLNPTILSKTINSKR